MVLHVGNVIHFR